MIVQRDIGQLAKYTFDMGGTGDLLSLSLSVPPWEALHELSPRELLKTNLVNTSAVADVMPSGRVIDPAVASLRPKSVDRFVSSSDEAAILPASKSTKTADAAALPDGGIKAVAPSPK